MSAKGNKFISEVQRFDKYAKWIPHLQRRETWAETVERVIDFFSTQLALQSRRLGDADWDALRAAMLRMDVLPSMRAVQMAGPAAARDHTHLYNCSYLPLDSPTALKELLYILMCGTGVGYSVEKQYIKKWRPVQQPHGDGGLAPYVIEDSSLGWAEAFHRAIDLSLEGIKPSFDYGRIRPKGAWLRTKGGRASGPEPLRRLLDGVWDIISARKGDTLTSFDIHRIACLAGSIVDVGGVRRAALIALFSNDDDVMLNCKTGDWFTKYPELAKANNSMVASFEDIESVVRTLASDGYGEPGLFNRQQAHRRAKGVEYGTNPCGEILLEPQQFCNLSIAVARPDDTLAMLEEKVRLATIWGTIQSCMTYFPNLRPEWTRNCERERLLGVDITGAQDCKLINSNIGRCYLETFLQDLRQVAVDTNREYAWKLGINPSAAITCNKPNGNSSQLVDSASGIHARWAPYYVRRLRIEAESPLGKQLVAVGLPTTMEGTNLVVEFPAMSPAPSVTKDRLDALNQLDYWLCWQRGWCDHNASSTIYVRPDEWTFVEKWLRSHWRYIGGLSFLPKDDHKYENAPYESITKEEYEQRVAALPSALDLDKIVEVVDNSTLASDVACVGGLCLLD